QFSEENQLKVLEYQIRSLIALEEDASQLIVNGKSQFPGNEQFFQVLGAWDDLKSFGVDDSPYFEDVKTAEFELQAILTAIYLVKLKKDIDQAIVLLTTYIDSGVSSTIKYNELEPILILIQLYLIKGNFLAANKLFLNFKNYPDSARDNIIYHVLESWLLSIKGESDNISNAYYFYDELLSSDFDEDSQGKAKILNVLFVLTLQLKHYPEAQEISGQIKALNGKSNADFVANSIIFDYLVNSGDNVEQLLTDLKVQDGEHPLLVDLEEKNQLFDEIVLKYKV
ncbi:hypothetical protein DFJ63DRAFT_98814, partial [Scheffersomyces coipomensis]|uniref:uncharacterized protein n=1 Tax=Scheffersomyces coipomensis TaxID=1788519 RepID=UPI00315CE635